MTELRTDQIESPLGTIVLVVDADHVCLCGLEDVDSDHEARIRTLLAPRYGQVSLKQAADPCGFSSRMRAYLDGDHCSIEAIPVSTGGTAFQQQVWAALRTIPPGSVRTYGELAAQIGNRSACRAVGLTNSLNPVAIIIPCHRVVGANATLTGYAGGLERKGWLLEHEGFDLATWRDKGRRGRSPSNQMELAEQLSLL